MESIPGKARLTDVARRAGVSRSTVSRVLSGALNVSPQAVRAVTAASAQLGYRPDPIARALRGASTGCIGMIVPGIGNPFFAELMEAVERALQLVDVELIVSDSQNNVDNELRRVTSLVARKVDALIIIPVDHEASAAALGRAADVMPVVQLDRQVDGFGGDYVGVDNTAGVRAVLAHLAGNGIDHVVFVSGDTSTSTGASRLAAFESGLRRLSHLHADAHLLGSFTFDYGRKSVGELLARGAVPQAIVCGSDIVALGVMRELRAQGLSVPADVMATGFDGIAFHELSEPSLTTVRQPIAEIAEEAVRLLLARLGGERGAPRRNEVTPTLRVRQSSTRDNP